MKFSGIIITLSTFYLTVTNAKALNKSVKGVVVGATVSSSDVASGFSKKDDKNSQQQLSVVDVLGDGGDANDHLGPTTWWGIPLERMPGLQEDITKLNSLLEDVAKDEYTNSDPQTYEKVR